MYEVRKSVNRTEMIGLGYKELGCMAKGSELRRLEEQARSNHFDLVCHQLIEETYIVYRKEVLKQKEYIFKTSSGLVLKAV